MFDYVRDPQEIYRLSFAAIRREANLERLEPDLRPLAERMVHAVGRVDIVEALQSSPKAARAGCAALQNGAPVLCDVGMVARGIIRSRLPKNNAVICTLDDDGVREAAHDAGATRAWAAVDRWGERLDGAVVAIGNAPTALFRLLELLADGAPRPALIVGMPVGFIGAAESKQALCDHAGDVPYLTLTGRMGGSALAAAAVNALCGNDA